jgi:hypothetical protein
MASLSQGRSVAASQRRSVRVRGRVGSPWNPFRAPKCRPLQEQGFEAAAQQARCVASIDRRAGPQRGEPSR